VQDEDGHWITFTPWKSEHRNYPPVRLLDRQYFVLGDNRDDSEDSREFEPISEDLLVGKAIATFARAERTK
jgi:type IV secretory pathway protease TraF